MYMHIPNPSNHFKVPRESSVLKVEVLCDESMTNIYIYIKPCNNEAELVA